ncbi:threonine/homoserine/homoserine lactone efflux protein [Nitrobacter vulgaris]|nr:threonine/homoserine/homoserine lactone efflux protein [Nitrobacter vulgaris]
MPVLMFSAILGCGLLFYVSYRYVRSHPPMREEREAPEDAPQEIAKGD